MGRFVGKIRSSVVNMSDLRFLMDIQGEMSSGQSGGQARGLSWKFLAYGWDLKPYDWVRSPGEPW